MSDQPQLPHPSKIYLRPPPPTNKKCSNTPTHPKYTPIHPHPPIKNLHTSPLIQNIPSPIPIHP